MVVKGTFHTAEPLPAIFIKRHGGGGAVRIFDDSRNSVRNILTGPEVKHEYVIVVLRSGEELQLLGTPSVRYFRRRTS